MLEVVMKILFPLIALMLLFFGCSSSPTESRVYNSFSIFLTMDIKNNSPDKTALDKIVLEKEPILSIQSITSYTWDNHLIEFSNEAKEIIKSREPLFGRFFIVIALNERIYWGLFTDDASSGVCQNPVIRVWSRSGLKNSSITNSFVIERAYPEYIGNENGADLRENFKIYTVLKQSGKLK